MQALIDRLQQTRTESAERIVAFQESLGKDAAYALNWSAAAFQAAARIKVIDRVLDAIEAGPTVSKLSAATTQIVTTLAVISMRSNTSTTSKLMEQYELAAYAEIVELLQADGK